MSARKERDIITPYKISVLLLIEKYGSLLPKFWDTEINSEFPDISPKESKATCMLVSTLIQGGENDVSLSELIDAVESSLISSICIKSFIEGLHELYKKGIEAFHSLFDSVEKFCIQDTQRSEAFPCLWTSMVGLYLRQLNLIFQRMTFFQIINLYHRYQAYYEDSFKVTHSELLNRHSLSLQNDSLCETTNEMSVEIGDTDCEMNDSCLPEAFFSMSTRSKKVLVKDTPKLKFCLSDEKSVCKANSLKTRQQAELFIQEQICLLLQQSSNALSSEKLQVSLSSILKNFPDLGKAHFLNYLNCLRMREFTGAMHSLVRSYDSKLYKDVSRGEDITRTFRYAALNMAALQGQFGHRSLGLMYLEEAMRLAQESNDHVCLQYSLAWLYVLSKSNKASLMKRSLSRSNELHLSQLTWLSLMNHAVQLSKTNAAPRTVLQNLVGLFSGQSLPWSWSEGSLASQPALWAVHSGLWASWGNLSLSAACAQLVLHMSLQPVANLHAPSASSSICASLCNLALMFANLGEFKLSSDVIHHAQEQFPSFCEHSKLWMFSQCFIAFYESLRQGLWSQASTFASSMSSIHLNYAKLLQAELKVAKGEFSEANEMMDDLLGGRTSIQFEDLEFGLGELVEPEVEVKCLLTKADALSGSQNFGGSLATIVKAISTAKQFHMIFLSSLAYLQMSCVQMHLGLLKEAKKSFAKGVDIVLSGGGVYDQARAKLLQAKLEVVCSSRDSLNEKLSFAASLAEEARQLFARVLAVDREKEAVYLKARFYNACGRVDERNCSALEFRQLEQRNPSSIAVANTCVL